MSTTKPVLLINGNPVGDIGGEGGSGGHTILDSSGTSLAQEDKLQFKDSHVTDDSTNGKTVVESFKAVTEAEYSSETEDGAYIITDGDGATIEPASDDYVEVTADGVKTLHTLMSDFYSLIDFSKVTENSYIRLADRIYRYNTSGKFVCTLFSNTEIYIMNICISSTTADCGGKTAYYNGTTWQYIDNNNNVFGNGTVITLYYGQKKAVVDLQTTANRCWLNNGQSVEQKFATTQISTGDSDIIAFKSGNVVSLSFIKTVTVSADTPFLTLPTNLRPPFIVDFKDSYSNKRIQIKKNGEVICTESLSSTVLRGMITYVSTQ